MPKFRGLDQLTSGVLLSNVFGNDRYSDYRAKALCCQTISNDWCGW